MGWFIIYIITIIIAYIIERYLVITRKFGMGDDPQIVSCIGAMFWPITIFLYLLFMFGDCVDKTIKKKVNG